MDLAQFNSTIKPTYNIVDHRKPPRMWPAACIVGFVPFCCLFSSSESQCTDHPHDRPPPKMLNTTPAKSTNRSQHHQQNRPNRIHPQQCRPTKNYRNLNTCRITEEKLIAPRMCCDLKELMHNTREYNGLMGSQAIYLQKTSLLKMNFVNVYYTSVKHYQFFRDQQEWKR